MPSPMVSKMNEYGLYYSRLEGGGRLLPAMRTSRKSGYAHFGGVSVSQVIGLIKDDDKDWIFKSSKEVYFILPKDLITW